MCKANVYVGICMWCKHMWMDVTVCIANVYVGICMWVQAYLDGCECFHR